ncbi:MAG: hypothetical protein AMXMBFR80_29180 [Dehalococcoidia bacterium]
MTHRGIVGAAEAGLAAAAEVLVERATVRTTLICNHPVTSILKIRIFLFLVFLLPGLFAIGYASKLALNASELSRYGMVATGTITSYERQATGGPGRIGRRFCAVIEFPHGETIKSFTDGWCNKSQEQYPVGSSVEVLFKPGTPAAARINEFGPLYGKSLFIALICTPWLSIGIALMVRIRAPG